jgi:glycine oxidase
MNAPDVTVVGGGIIGCSIAWRLAQKKLSVSIYEANRVGSEASWAGAGMLAPGGEVDRESPWARRSVESLRIYPAFLNELHEESGLAVDYRPCGAIEVAYSEDELAADQARASSQADLGIPSERLSADDALGRVPSLNPRGLLGGFLYPGDAIVDPREVVAALRLACERRGVRIEEGHRVESLTELNGGAAVIAAGAWASTLSPDLPEAFPVKGYLAGYRLPRGAVGPILRRGHTYILQRSNGFTIAGSTTERAGFDRTVNPTTVQSLHRRAHELLPSLLIASPEESWVGFRPGAAGDEPQVRRFGKSRVWLAYGHYRNGILLAPITADLIARDITAS